MGGKQKIEKIKMDEKGAKRVQEKKIRMVYRGGGTTGGEFLEYRSVKEEVSLLCRADPTISCV